MNMYMGGNAMKYGFVTVSVKNMEESADFYKNVLGLKEATRFSPQPGIDIMILKDGEGSSIELITHPGEEAEPVKASVSIGFKVESIEATMAMLKEKGVTVARGPMGVPGGARFIFINDPNGVGIEFIEGFEI